MTEIVVEITSPPRATDVRGDERFVCTEAEKVVRDWMSQGAGVGIRVESLDLAAAERVREYLHEVGAELGNFRPHSARITNPLGLQGVLNQALTDLRAQKGNRKQRRANAARGRPR